MAGQGPGTTDKQAKAGTGLVRPWLVPRLAHECTASTVAPGRGTFLAQAPDIPGFLR